MRIDENTEFDFLFNVVDKEEQKGPWRLCRGVGDLGYASQIFAVNDDEQCVIPIQQVLELQTGSVSFDLLTVLKSVMELIGDEDLPDNGELSGAAICDMARAAIAERE